MLRLLDYIVWRTLRWGDWWRDSANGPKAGVLWVITMGLIALMVVMIRFNGWHYPWWIKMSLTIPMFVIGSVALYYTAQWIGTGEWNEL